MKQKNLFYLLTCCSLFFLALTACSDDNNDVPPTSVVTNLTFTDTDINTGKISGTLAWELPAAESDITGYNIYLGSSATQKEKMLGVAPKSATSFIVPAGTDYAPYLLVVAINAFGESNNAAAVAVTEADLPADAVSNLSFTNTATDPALMSGLLSWTLPASESNITGYTIYTGSAATQKGKALATVPKGAASFEVPEDTGYAPFLLVVAINASGESTNMVSIAIEQAIPPKIGVYILNSGNYNENNASLSFFDFTSGTITGDLYKTANGSGLGDSAEQVLLYGSRIYITVPTSNRLVVLDKDYKLIKSIEPKDGGNTMNPRSMVAYEGKVYVSYFYGHRVAALDTASLTVEKTAKVGRYPEQLTVANGKLYVANSGGLDFPDYGTTVSVVDLASFQEEKTIDVLLNPTNITSDSQGDVYVTSMGNYADVKNTLQRIDGRTGEVTVIGNASRMSLVNNKLYYMYAQWDNPDTQFKIYDVLTEKIVNDNFITDGTTISSPEALGVDPATGKIYITEAPYGSTSSMYIFSADGKLERSPVDTKGYYAKSLAFPVK